MEIERKFLIDKNKLPQDYKSYPAKELRQGYVLHRPALRIRREKNLPDGDTKYIMTYKDKGGLARQEINVELPHDAGEKLFSKCDGHIYRKDPLPDPGPSQGSIIRKGAYDRARCLFQ